MKRTLAVLTLVAAFAPSATWAGPTEEARAIYDRFVAAQNARDLDKVRPLLLDSPQFLWVSDGMTFWGRETMLERMASFQEAEVWRVEPELDKAVAVEVDAGAAYLHLPLKLVIGASSSPDRIRFLVSMLCKQTIEGWRIAALFTTTSKEN
jgi:Domain of unknown function (DUF4440)